MKKTFIKGMNERFTEWMNEWTDKWMDGWMQGLKDKWAKWMN